MVHFLNICRPTMCNFNKNELLYSSGNRLVRPIQLVHQKFLALTLKKTKKFSNKNFSHQLKKTSIFYPKITFLVLAWKSTKNMLTKVNKVNKLGLKRTSCFIELKKLELNCYLIWLLRSSFFLNSDSLHARLNSHYKAWSYKKKKNTKKSTGYRKSV